MDTTLDNYRFQGCYGCGNQVKVKKFGSRCALCERCQNMFRAWRGQPKPPVALQRKALPKKIQLKQEFIKSFCRQAMRNVQIKADNVGWALAMHRSKYFSVEEIKQHTHADKSLMRWIESQEQTGERQLLWLLGNEGQMMRDYRNVNGVAIRNAQEGWALEV